MDKSHPRPGDPGLAEDQSSRRLLLRIFGYGHLSMFRRNCQTFRPIVRPHLGALTELDLDVAVAPDNPNLSTWIRSGGLLNTQRYLHPRLPHRLVFTALAPSQNVRDHQKSWGKQGVKNKKAVKTNPGEKTPQLFGLTRYPIRGRDLT